MGLDKPDPEHLRKTGQFWRVGSVYLFIFKEVLEQALSFPMIGPHRELHGGPQKIDPAKICAVPFLKKKSLLI